MGALRPGRRRPASTYACVADRVFDGEQVLNDQAVVVRGERIAGLVPVAALPPGLPVVSAPGCTLVPGLIDMHAHFMRWEGPLFLAYGVTSVRDTGNALDWILARRAEWPSRAWPRVYALGPILDGPQAYHALLSRACADLDDAVAAVRQTAAAGVDGIKLYVNLDAGWIAPMAAAAHAQGLKVSSHSVGTGTLFRARAGVDEVFHLDGLLPDVWPGAPPGWLDAWGLPGFARTWDRQKVVADEMARLGLTVTPTLAYWDSCWRTRSPGYPHASEGRYVPSAFNRSILVGRADPEAAARWRAALAAAQRFTGLLIERGASVLTGSDVPCGGLTPGLSLWRELQLLVEAGMAPSQALGAATRQAAAFLGQNALGRIAAGAMADLAFVRGNPLTGLPEDPVVPMVIRAGQLFRLDDLLVEAQAAAQDLRDDPAGAQWLPAEEV